MDFKSSIKKIFSPKNSDEIAIEKDDSRRAYFEIYSNRVKINLDSLVEDEEVTSQARKYRKKGSALAG